MEQDGRVERSAAMPSVSVAMAFHRPSPVLARRQIESLVAQEGVRLSIAAVIDGAETAGDEELMALLTAAGAAITVNGEALGIRRAFATGLGQAIAAAQGDDGFFAYCDQDDVWHPEKLRLSVAALRGTGAALVHCDARVLDGAGHVIAPSLHRFEARREAGGLLEAMLVNSVTGMTAVFTARTARLAAAVLERYQGELLHDHVTAAVAAGSGGIALVDRVLADYVQHGGNQIGARPPRPVLRRRAIGASHLKAYRATSREIFESRRALANALAEEGLLPPQLETLFLLGPSPSKAQYAGDALRQFAKLMRAGQFRRAGMAARIADGALSFP